MKSFVVSKIKGMRIMSLAAAVCAAMACAADGSGLDESEFVAIFNGGSILLDHLFAWRNTFLRQK